MVPDGFMPQKAVDRIKGVRSRVLILIVPFYEFDSGENIPINVSAKGKYRTLKSVHASRYGY